MYDPKFLFLSLRGRIGRQPYWVAVVCFAVAHMALDAIPIMGAFLGVTLLWPFTCVLIKRLHDMGRAGWPAALMGVVCAVMSMISAVMGLLVSSPATVGLALALAGFPVLLASVVGVASLILLVSAGVAPGEAGPNRYGVPMTEGFRVI